MAAFVAVLLIYVAVLVGIGYAVAWLTRGRW